MLFISSDLGLLYETKEFIFKNFKMIAIDEATYVIDI